MVQQHSSTATSHGHCDRGRWQQSRVLVCGKAQLEKDVPGVGTSFLWVFSHTCRAGSWGQEGSSSECW